MNGVNLRREFPTTCEGGELKLNGTFLVRRRTSIPARCVIRGMGATVFLEAPLVFHGGLLPKEVNIDSAYLNIALFRLTIGGRE